MADSSSNVATVAIIVIVIAAIIGGYYFMKHGGMGTSDTTKVDVTVPSTGTTSTTTNP